MIVTRRGFLKGLVGALAVAAVPTRAYSFLWDNPLAATAAPGVLGSGAFQRALAANVEQIREDFAWYMNDHLLWKPATKDDAFEVTSKLYMNLTSEKPTHYMGGRLIGVEVPCRELWGRAVVGVT